MSTGQTAVLAAVLNGRRGLIAEVIPDYLYPS
jgi:hypothetical protein